MRFRLPLRSRDSSRSHDNRKEITAVLTTLLTLLAAASLAAATLVVYSP